MGNFPKDTELMSRRLKKRKEDSKSLLFGLIPLNLMLLRRNDNYVLWKTRKERHRGRK